MSYVAWVGGATGGEAVARGAYTGPVINPITLANGQVGEAFSATFTAVGTAPLTWSIATPPEGMAVSAAGVFSGAPRAAGTYSVTVVVTDSTGLADTVTVPWTVAASAKPWRTVSRAAGPWTRVPRA